MVGHTSPVSPAVATPLGDAKAAGIEGDAVGSVVDHDFAEDGAEQSTESVGDAVRRDVDVSGAERSAALDVESRS